VWRRYLGEIGKFLSYFVANLSKTLRINFYQNRSSIVEVMIKKFWCLFYASQCIYTNYNNQLWHTYINEVVVQYVTILGGRPVGRITLLARPSVRPYGLVTRKQRNADKSKLARTFPMARSKWSANFQFERSKVKVTGCKKTSEIWRHLYWRAAEPADQARWALTSDYATPLLGLLYCRCPSPLATGRPAAYNVGADISRINMKYMKYVFWLCRHDIRFVHGHKSFTLQRPVENQKQM